MKSRYASLSHVLLEPRTTYERPPQPPPLVHLDSPALEVMTDFKIVRAVTTPVSVTIDDALENMKTSGVRLLLVVDDDDQIVGILTASDVQGEKPIRLVEEERIPRSRITVDMIMTPQPSIPVLNMLSVRNVQVGNVVATLHRLERQHVLVVEVDPETKGQRVRGLFSLSQIGKQLGRDVSEVMTAAHSLAEIQREMR